MFLLNSDIFIWDLSILLFMTFSLCGGIACITWTKKHPEKSFQRVIIGFLGFLGFLVFLVITYASFIEPQIIVVTKVTVTHPQAQPLKIAVVSDPHVGPYKGDVFLQRVVKRINSLLPDLVLMPGDDVTMEVTLLSPIAMDKDVKFAIREGGRTVGSGVVAEVTE